jgi:hypothetical protein
MLKILKARIRKLRRIEYTATLPEADAWFATATKDDLAKAQACMNTFDDIGFKDLIFGNLSYDGMSLTKLRSRAKAYKLPRWSKMGRDDLIIIIKRYEQEKGISRG